MKVLKYTIIIWLGLLLSCQKEEANCFDGILNGTETGTDCGGDCDPCISCFDGIQNGTEVGIDCGGECSPCLSSEKEITNIIFEDAPSGFEPIIDIDNSNLIVHITAGKIFPTHDFTNLDFDLELSDGASISNIPSDFTTPRLLTITAENGSTAEYLFIVTGAYGTYSIDFSNGSSAAGDTKAIYKGISTFEDNDGIAARFSGITTAISQNYWYAFDFRLANETFETSLIGTHDLTASGNDFSYTYPSSSGNGLNGLSNPSEGELIITHHDTQNKLISGYSNNIAFSNIPSQSGVIYYPYVEFINVRYD